MQYNRTGSVPEIYHCFSLNPVLRRMYMRKTLFGKNPVFFRYTTFLTNFKSYIYVIIKKPLYVKFQVQLRYTPLNLGICVHFVKIALRQFFKTAYN